jgi:hypothetical protein
MAFTTAKRLQRSANCLPCGSFSAMTNPATVPDRRCTICGAHLDIQSDPFSVDMCMADAGDPDCLERLMDWVIEVNRELRDD